MTNAGRRARMTSLGISHYHSLAINLVLDRSWMGTLPSSQIKNAYLLRKDRDDGGKLHQFIQIITYAGRYGDTHLGICKKISKHMHNSQTLHTHMIQQVTWGQKSLDWRASHLKIEWLAIHHTLDILSHSRACFIWFVKLLN